MITRPDVVFIVVFTTLSSKVKTVFLLGLATTAAVLTSEVLTNACVVISLLSACKPAPILKLFSVPANALIVIAGKLTVPES